MIPRLVIRSTEGAYCISGLAPPPWPSEIETSAGLMVLRRVRPTYVLYAPKEPPQPEAA